MEIQEDIVGDQAEARALDSLLRATGKPLTVCGNGFPEAATVAEWAAWHGANTPQEVALFKDSLKGINGERLGKGKSGQRMARGETQALVGARAGLNSDSFQY